jgi:2-oxoglutarate ferredoxin oxidoreductase subunit delta
MEECPKNVIGRINLPWHKHARIVNGSNCTGCMNCVKICQYGAFYLIPDGAKQEAVK